MTDPVERHAASVDAWLDRASGLPRTQLVDAFEQAFDALWARALRSLGEVTLTAIVDRVLSVTTDAFPVLGALHVGPKRLLFRDFRARSAGFSTAELANAIRFVLLEFLTILGNLTADILTPALHSELSNVGIPKKKAMRGAAPAATAGSSGPRSGRQERPTRARRAKERSRPLGGKKP